MIEGLQLGGSGYMPNLTFEVMSILATEAVISEVSRFPQFNSLVTGTPDFDPQGFSVHVGQDSYPADRVNVYWISPGSDASLIGGYEVDPDYGAVTLTGSSDVSCFFSMGTAAADSAILYDDAAARRFYTPAARVRLGWCVLPARLGHGACQWDFAPRLPLRHHRRGLRRPKSGPGRPRHRGGPVRRLRLCDRR